MKTRHLRFWLLLGCVGCAKLAGFEDFEGGGSAGAGGESGAQAQQGGRAPSAGRGGSVSPSGGSAPEPMGGRLSEAGSDDSEAGSGGTNVTGGRPASSGGADSTSAGEGGEPVEEGGAPGASGGSAAGGQASGGAPSGGATSGGASNGGSTGGNAAGGVPTATGGGPNTTGCGELVFNGDFSHGRDGWTITSDYLNLEANVHPIIAAAGSPELTAFGVTPLTDSYLGWFGGVPKTEAQKVVMASQVVTLSQDLANFEFRGSFQIVTEEDASENTEYDHFYVELRTIEDNTQLGWQFEHLSNLDANGGWAPMVPQHPDPSDLPALRGRSFYFMAYSRTDADLRTDFWIDSLSLVAVCP